MAAAVLIARRVRRMVQAYRDAGALDPRTARRPDELGVASGLILARLVRAGVLVDAGDGRYYLDPIAADRFNRRRRARGWAVLGVLLVVFVVLLLLVAW